MTEYKYVMFMATKDKAIGEQLYLALKSFKQDPLPGGDLLNLSLTASGNDAWGHTEVATSAFTDVATVYMNGGYPQALIDLGKSEAEIDTLREIVQVGFYDRYPGNSRIDQPEALTDFLQTNGYELKTPD